MNFLIRSLGCQTAVAGMLVVGALTAHAAVRPENVHSSDLKKSEAYVKDGLIVGGDRVVDHVIVKDIRHAMNAGYERLVLDVEGTVGGAPTAIPRSPYFQIAMNADENRLIVTLWGSPKLGFDPTKVIRAFRKSKVFSSVDLFPKIEEDSWTFALNVKGNPSVEVFELKDPVRIIVDVKSGARK